MAPRAYAGPLTVVLAALTLAAAPAGAQLREAAGVEARLDVAAARYGATEPLKVRFSLENRTAEPRTVLKWHTPLEGFNSDMFVVERDGRRVPYIGREVKRGAPTPEDYVTIEPGGSVSADVDLAEGYAVAEPGRYQAQLQTTVFDIRAQPTGRTVPLSELQPRELRSNAVSFELTAARTPSRAVTERVAPPPAEAGAAAKEPAFTGCSDSQKSQLDEAHTKASQIAAGSLLALAGLEVAKRPNAPRYKTWFGAYTAARYGTAIDHFTKIHGALINETITFDCSFSGCSSSWYAYVYPNSPYIIHLCNSFWSAPLEGTDSRSGTIVHETSHFNVVADTDDNAYGQTACKNLANNDPTKAIANADSHEYFAENTPFESMGLDHLVLTLVLVLALVAADRWRRRRATREAAIDRF